MDDGGDNEKWYEWERTSMTEVELWMIEWVWGENEIRFRTSGGASAWGMEKLSVLRAVMQSWSAALLIQLQWRRIECSQHRCFYLSNIIVCLYGCDLLQRMSTFNS